MKSKKFDSKVYLGKSKIYQPVPGAPRVSKLYVWDTERKEYGPTASGKVYVAKRYEHNINGVVERKFQFFQTLDEARKWQAGADERSKIPNQTSTVSGQPAQTLTSGPKLNEIVEKWRKRSFPTLAYGTQLQYEKLLRLHFESLLGLSIHAITPQRVDQWLDELRDKATDQKEKKKRVRKNLKHELTLLSTLLRFYLDYEDDLQFHFPIKDRHWNGVHLQKKSKKSSKDFTVEEFERFRKALRAGPNGAFFSALATVQYFQALRISEAAAIFVEDIYLKDNCSQSRLMVQRSVLWPRRKGISSYVQMGFKNAAVFDDGVKEQPIFPETYDALKFMLNQPRSTKNGLLFELNGKHLEYRQIQYAYDTAFQLVELSYRGTHVLRHGGCRNLYNESGDLSVAQQLLGDKSEQATKVYAERRASALTGVSDTHWEKRAKEVETDGNRWREQKPNLKIVS